MKSDLKIYIVNLKSSLDRRTHMEEQLLKYCLGFEYEFISAVDGRLLDDNFYKNLTDEDLSQFILQRPLTRGEVGCYLSHLSLYQKIANEGIEHCIVLEDDVFLNENFNHFLRVVKNIDSEFEYVNLSNFPDSSLFFNNKKIDGSRFVLKEHTEGVWGTYGYYISHKGARKLLSNSLPKIVVPIDYLCRVYGRERLKCGVVHPFVVVTDIPQMGHYSQFPSLINLERKIIEQDFKVNKVKIFLKRLVRSVRNFIEG